MRDYAKVAPTFWTGRTGRAIRQKGPEATVVALYLMSSPHSNMLGLFYQPILYMAHETGLGQEGALKGLRWCIEAGFCKFDEASEMVWVMEMASYQIGEALDPKDKRCKGVAKDYAALPECPFLGEFFDRYAEAFCLPERRQPSGSAVCPIEGASKPGTGAGAGTGSVSGEANASPSSTGGDVADKLPPCPHRAIVDAYHEILPELPSVQLREGTKVWPKRQAAMRDLWVFALTTSKSDGTRRATNAEEALAWIRGYFERARENDFLMGRIERSGKHAGWRADLDYLLTERGMKHVIEKAVSHD